MPARDYDQQGVMDGEIMPIKPGDGQYRTFHIHAFWAGFWRFLGRWLAGIVIVLAGIFLLNLVMVPAMSFDVALLVAVVGGLVGIFGGGW